MKRPPKKKKLTSTEEAIAVRRHPVVMVIVDVMNPMDFPQGKALLRNATPMARRIARLKHRLKAAGVPVIYVNDNYGLWRSEKREVIAQATAEDSLGSPVARALLPDEDDFFVLKPKYSAFFSTTLETLLKHLGAETLVLCGLSANICLLHTAFDAYARGYRLVLPRDCLAANTRRDATYALRLFRTNLSAATPASKNVSFR